MTWKSVPLVLPVTDPTSLVFMLGPAHIVREEPRENAGHWPTRNLRSIMRIGVWCCTREAGHAGTRIGLGLTLGLSNIRFRGVQVEDAANRILDLIYARQPSK